MRSATIDVGITGVAEPNGGTPEKSVGTVWIAVDMRGDTTARVAIYIGDRAEIRHRATQAAMDDPAGATRGALTHQYSARRLR